MANQSKKTILFKRDQAIQKKDTSYIKKTQAIMDK